MKTLKQLYNEIINDIFRSYTEEHKELINHLFKTKTKQWLQEQLRELEKENPEPTGISLTLYMTKHNQLEKLIEELE